MAWGTESNGGCGTVCCVCAHVVACCEGVRGIVHLCSPACVCTELSAAVCLHRSRAQLAHADIMPSAVEGHLYLSNDQPWQNVNEDGTYDTQPCLPVHPLPMYVRAMLCAACL